MSFKRYFPIENIQEIMEQIPEGATHAGILVTVDEDPILIPMAQIEYSIPNTIPRQHTESRVGCPYPPPCLPQARTAQEVIDCINQLHQQIQGLNERLRELNML